MENIPIKEYEHILVVANIPAEKGIPVIQLERKIGEINDSVKEFLKKRL